MAYPLGYGDPVGNALGAAEKGFALGTAIRRQPQLEAQQKAAFDAEQLQRERAGALEQYQLMDKQRQNDSAQSNRELTYHINDLNAKYGKGGPRDLSVQGNAVDPDDRDGFASALIGSGVPLHIGTPQFKTDVGTVFDTVGGQGASYKSPDFAQAANRLYAPSINHGAMQSDNIAQQNIRQIVPGQGGSLHVDLANTRNDGTTYNAPLTLGRTSDDHDPVKPISAEQAINHTVALAQLDQHIGENPILQRVMADIQSMPPDKQFDYMMRLGRSRLASSQGRVQPAEGEIATDASGKPMTSANGYFVVGADGKPQHVETLHGAGQSRLAEAEEAVQKGYAKSVPEYLNMVNPKAGGANFYSPPTPQAKQALVTDDKGNEHWLPEGQEIPQGWHVSPKNGSGGGAAAAPADDSVAAQVATGQPLTQVIPGYGKAAATQRAQARTSAINLIKQQNPGMSDSAAGEELANRSVDYASGKHSNQQLTTMLGATKAAVDQLDFNADKATEEMKKLGSSDLSPVVNAIARGEEKWTGNPAYSSLYFYMHAAAMESARIQSGGQASVAQLNQGAAEEAQKWANVNMTPASWEAVKKAMKAEGQNRIENYQKAVKGTRSSRSAAPASGGSQDNPTKVSTKAERDALPAGSYYVGPDGHVSVKN